ncbi:MAG: hypothetical protein AAF682_24645 [Planctomycetota bacterium]
MNPRDYIRDLCRRYGVSAAFGDRMLPLAERAENVRPEMRERLLAFLERSFVAQVEVEAQQSGEAPPKATGSAPPSTDELHALGTVANVLHGWDPPRWLDKWAERLQEAPEEPTEE